MPRPMIELTTERKSPRLAIDQRPTWLPFIRVQRRLRVDALGRYWSPWALLALAFIGAGVWALLRLAGRTR